MARIAILTGESHAGKSFSSRRVRDRCGAPILEHDVVIPRWFESVGAGNRGYSANIPELWAHLRHEADFDGSFRKLHVDEFIRLGSPGKLIVEGWLYGIREWRQQLVQAFRELNGPESQFHLFVIKHTADEYFKRHKSALEERQEHTDSRSWSEEQKRQSADWHMDRYYNEFDGDKIRGHKSRGELAGAPYLQLPENDEMDCRMGPNEEMETEIVSWLAEECRQ